MSTASRAQRPQLGAPRAAAQRAVSAKSRLSLKCALRSARERHAAARPSHAGAAARARPTQPRGPRKTAHTQSTRAGARRRDSESRAAANAGLRGARARGHGAAGATPRASRAPLPKDRTHTPNTRPRLRIPTKPIKTQARIAPTGPVPRLRGRRRHPRDQAQRQEGGRPLRQDHEPHQEALLRPRLQVHQAQRP